MTVFRDMYIIVLAEAWIQECHAVKNKAIVLQRVIKSLDPAG